jgi:hypothetical protein
MAASLPPASPGVVADAQTAAGYVSSFIGAVYQSINPLYAESLPSTGKPSGSDSRAREKSAALK